MILSKVKLDFSTNIEKYIKIIDKAKSTDFTDLNIPISGKFRAFLQKKFH